MAHTDPYEVCPVLETARFMLRLVAMDDAADLMACYSDTATQELFNADNCSSDFRYATVAEMADCIQSWINAYQARNFIRFAIIDKEISRAIGTIEMFSSGNFGGVLRLDIASAHETEACLTELVSLCIAEFHDMFQVKRMVTKAIPAAVERVRVLQTLGFEPISFKRSSEAKPSEHYWAHKE